MTIPDADLLLLLYQTLASDFSSRIKVLFASEESLKVRYELDLAGAPFDRTFFWNVIIPSVFEESWQSVGPKGAAKSTKYDRKLTACFLHRFLDYNLFTQVLPNFYAQELYGYDSLLASQLESKLKEKYAGRKELNPFTPKAKMIKQAEKAEEITYNLDLSALKAASTIARLTPSVSYRVTPIGSTPAFADSANLSMLGHGADQFLRVSPGYKVGYLSWASARAILKPKNDGSFMAEGIEYPFRSKSGGEILGEVLFSRFIAHKVWSDYYATTTTEVTVLPRMNSVMVVAKDIKHLESLAEQFNLSLTEDHRPEW